MATAITTTAQDITGDFDLVVRQTFEPGGTVIVLKSLGSASTDWKSLGTFNTASDSMFIKNTGTNSYKLLSDVTGVAVEFNQ